MCFSASASFTAAAVLMPLGLYTHHLASEAKRPGYRPLALVPFFFGLQQFIEGFVWVGLGHGETVASPIEPLTSITSVGFLFFAYCFWMIWIPWSAYSIGRHSESEGVKRALRWVWIIGSILGISFWLPLLVHPPLIQPGLVTGGRIVYNVNTIFHNFINTEPIGELIYWCWIVIPLLILKDKAVKLFGALIVLSIILTLFTYSMAFNSVWCFYSAILSIVVLWIVNRPEMRRA